MRLGWNSRATDIFHPDITLSLDRPSQLTPSSTPTDIDVYLRARERSRIALRTGTDLGNVEGSAYLNILLRNCFGGAESLNLNASTGTRTRSAYNATFETPVQSNPDRRVSIEGFQSSVSNFWASHEEVVKGAKARYGWQAAGGAQHQITYTGVWRQVTGLAKNASLGVRADAGDSVKSSLSHIWVKEARDNPMLPQQGYMLRSVSEIAGWGPLGGDVAFWKSEVEGHGAVSVPLPGREGDSGISIAAGLRAGVLYPMGLGFGGSPKASRINDRFQLGGPTDVRGFKLGGLGPRDGVDALGGDVFAAASIALRFPVPRTGPTSPLRLQIFANGGRLLALRPGDSGSASDSAGASSVQRRILTTMGELGTGLPSIGAGVGLVYAHPAARFELNFGLPLVMRRGEEGRKGVQFGVGLNFL